MSDVEISDEDIGEIRSEDELDLEVIQEPVDGEGFHETANIEQDAGETDQQKQEPKIKRVRNPQPKLNADRLKGPRGIQTIEGILSKIKFKGRGHEEEDLNSLMRGYEYWCHRLFPKYTFDDCLDKIERLGTKKEIQTHIKKIRMNLLFEDDINGTAPNDDEIENSEAQSPPLPAPDDPFNALLALNNKNPGIGDHTVASQSQPDKLTEEQLERMRINRERAQRIRTQKMISMRGANSIINESQPDLFNPTDFVNPELSHTQSEVEHVSNSEEILVGNNNMEVDLVNNEILPMPVEESQSSLEINENNSISPEN